MGAFYFDLYYITRRYDAVFGDGLESYLEHERKVVCYEDTRSATYGIARIEPERADLLEVERNRCVTFVNFPNFPSPICDCISGKPALLIAP